MNYHPPKPPGRRKPAKRKPAKAKAAKARPAPKSAKAKMQAYRAKMRAAGLRPIQIWVPDVNSKRFQQKLRRQIASLDPKAEKETLDFIESVADIDGWE